MAGSTPRPRRRPPGVFRQLAIGAIALLTVGCAAHPEPRGGQVLAVPTTDALVSLRIGGTGSPTIVLESNMRDDLSVWYPLYDSLAQLSSTVAYSRVGYGESEWRGPGELGTRTPVDVARTLKEALDRAGAREPYLLVAHSMGAIYAMQFAKEYPDETVGLLLIDGAVPTYYRACAAAGLDSCTPPAELLRIAPAHIRAELLGLPLGEPDFAGPSDLDTLPLTLITAAEPPRLLPGDQEALWREVQTDFVSAIPGARIVHADGASHYVHTDRPDVVLAEIRRLLENRRDSGARSDAGS